MVIFAVSLLSALLLVAGAVRAFNWLLVTLGLDDDSWPMGPR